MPNRFFANREFVLVALVEVPLVKVRSPKPLIPEKVLLSARRVEEAEEPPPERQVPAIEKQPAARLIPFEALVVPVRSVVVPIVKPKSGEGVEVASETWPFAAMRKSEVVAEPFALVLDATSNSAV